MNIREKFQKFIKDNEADLYSTLKELCLIPAPSGIEDERAALIRELPFVSFLPPD